MPQTRSVGDSPGNLASLKADGSFLARHISPGGIAGQVLTKDSTAHGMAWEDAAAGSLNTVAHDGTLGGLGTIGNPLRIADNSITEGLIDASNAPTDDQVLTWDDVNDRMYWGTVSGLGDITGVTAGAGLTGGGTSGTVTLDVNVGLPSFPVITIDKGGTGATTAVTARAQLGLGTASILDSGAAAGNVPVLDSTGHLLDSIIPDSVTFDSELESAISQHLANSVTGNNETGITVTYDTNEKFNFVVTGQDVHTNAQLTGNGTISNPLGIAANAIGESNIDIGNVPQDTQVLAWDQANNRLIWKDDATATPGSGLTAVSHSTEFTGTGETTNPLNLADDSILPTRLNFTNAPTDAYVVAYDSATMNFMWAENTGGGGVGDITAVVAGDGLSGGGDSGSVTLDIAVGETSFPIIPINKGGTAAITAGAARTNLGLNTAVTVISEVNGQLRIGYVDGSTFEIPLEPDGNFHGYGHMVEEGGDSFLRTPSGTTFAFGDFAVADDILYIHQRSAQTTGVQPDTIAGLDYFSRIPVLDSANQIIPLQAIIAVDSRILDRLQNAPSSGASFSDRILTWDDSNPTELRSANIGAIRGYTTSGWAQPTNNDVIPIAKLASGGTTNQVLGWTSSGQVWTDPTGMGGGLTTVSSDSSFSGDGTSGDPLTLDPAPARTALGLGSAALRTVGDAATNVPVLQSDASLIASHIAPGGTTSQVLTRTGSGKEWANASGGGFTVSSWDNASTYSIGNIVTQNNRAWLSRTNSNTGNDPDLEASAGNWFLIRTSEEIIHTAGRFYAPGTVVNSTGGGADVFIARRPTTDTPSEFDADWYHLPRGATVLEATTTANPYRSGTLVYIGDDMYFCHTSVPAPGITAADIPGSADFVSLSSGGLTNVQHDDSFTGIGTLGSPLSLNVAGSTFPIIPVIKGGTGSATPTGARFTLGLGTAATRNIDINEGDVAELGPSGLFHSDRMAIGGAPGQILTKTAGGQEWQDLGAGDFTLSQIGTYQFPAGFTTGQDDQLFDTGFTGPANTAQVYHVVFGDNNGRFGTALFLGSEIAGLNAEAAPVWVDGTTVGVSELAGNSRSFPIGTNRALYLGITTGGNLSIGSTHSGIRPYVTLSEVDGGGGGGTDTNDYVDSASLSLSSANRLSFSLGRTGSLADVSSNTITLPAGGGGVIVPTSVTHSGNTYTITTGLGLTSIPVGAQFLFQPGATNSAGVNVIVDSVSGTHSVILANGAFFGQIEAVPAGLLRVGDVYILIWDHNNAEFGLFPTKVGLSAFYSTGTGANEIPVLNTSGVLDSGILASGGSNEQVLTRTNSGQEWANANIGNITSISTGFSNGLSGGGTTGTVNLSLSFSQLGTQNGIDGADWFAYGDASNGTRMQRIALSNLVGFIADQSTLSSANSKIRIADEGIQEVHLDATNTPTDGQVLSSVGGGQFAWANSVATQLYFPVPDSGVGGTANAITLTSGDSLSAYANGQRFFFSANSNNTGAVTVNVDGIAAVSVQRSSGTGSSQTLTGGEIAADDPYTVIYGSDDNAFYLLPDLQGTAARRNVGDSEHDVAVLQSDASFTAGHLAPGGTDTQVLTRTATGKAWMDVAGGGGGTGDITAVTTASGSGLSGGVTTGAADLALDIAGLTNLSSTALADNDILFIGDVSDAADPRKHLTVGGLMSFATAGESTTDSGGGKIRVANRGIDVAQLSITGTPTTGQFISYDGSGMEWATPSGGGTAYTDADVDARILDRQQFASSTGSPESNDRILMFDFSNPATLRNTQMGSIRDFTTLTWAQSANADLIPSDKLASGGAADQVLTWTATGQSWLDASSGGGLQAGSIATMSPVVLSSTVNVPHGLGRAPDWLIGYLECLTAEFGYAVGDRVPIYNLSRAASGADDTNIWVSTDDNTYPYIVPKAGGNDSQITGTSWSLTAIPYITDGSGMGGGGGDITGVAVGVGLTGGGDTGDVTINLDLNALPALPAITITDRVVVLDASDSGAAKDQSLGDFSTAIATYMRLNLLSLEPQIVATDNFIFADASNANATRRVTWGGAIARMADQDTLITANAVMRINDGGVDSNELADDAVTRPKLDASNTATVGQVLQAAAAGRFTWGNAGTGDITSVAAGSGLSGGGTTGAVTLSIAANGVDTNELADASVTEPKILAINTPTAGQVLAFAAGNQFAWSDAGTGDITSVAATSGLSGGGTTGAVSLGSPMKA